MNKELYNLFREKIKKENLKNPKAKIGIELHSNFEFNYSDEVRVDLTTNLSKVEITKILNSFGMDLEIGFFRYKNKNLYLIKILGKKKQKKKH